jgi:hypothetical protein
MKGYPSFLLLAIEVRRSRFGYALFEGPERLLDWGGSAVPPGFAGRAATEAARKRIASVLRRGSPAAIVVDRPRRTKTSPVVPACPVFKSILREAETLKVPVHLLSREEIRAAFRIFPARSKEQIACVLVSEFPELTHRLPLKRKKWEPEKRGMIVFDAIAVGLAYWLRNGTESPPPE